jgi:formyltetrahydrofolate hydrolase
MKVLFYTAKNISIYDAYLIDRFAKETEHEVTLILLSRKKGRLRILSRYYKREGLRKTIEKMRDSRYLKKRRILRERWVEYMLGFDFAEFYKNIETCHFVDSHKKAKEIIADYKFDVMVQAGAGILKPEIFRLPEYGTLNVHFGTCVRGISSIFWALYYGRPDWLGVTVHRISEGIDKGAILRQEPLEVETKDDLVTLLVKATKLGVKLLIKAVDDFERGGGLPREWKDGVYLSEFTKEQYLKLQKNDWRQVETFTR